MKSKKSKKTLRIIFAVCILAIWWIFYRFYLKTTFDYAQKLCDTRAFETVNETITLGEIKASSDLKHDHDSPFSEYFKEKVRETLWKDDFSYGFSIMREILWENSDESWDYYCIAVEWKIADFSVSLNGEIY